MENMRCVQERMLHAQDDRKKAGENTTPKPSSVKAIVTLQNADAAVANAYREVAKFMTAFDRVCEECGLSPTAANGVREVIGRVHQALGDASGNLIEAHAEAMETCIWNKINVPVPTGWARGVTAMDAKEGC